MVLIPRRRRRVFLVMLDGPGVRRRFHGKGPSLMLTWLMIVNVNVKNSETK